MGVGSIHKYLEDGLATAVILEALRDLKARADKAAQENDEWFTPWEYTSHPGGGVFGKRGFLRALDEQIDIHEKRQSDIWSGFIWARVMIRRHQEEVAELIIKHHDKQRQGVIT